MPFNATLADALARSANMIEHHLADFAEAELFVRPVPGANHAAWQLSHLVHFDLLVARTLSPDAGIPEATRLGEAVAKGTNAVDDPSRFPKRDELIAMLRLSTEALVKVTGGMSDADLDRASPAAFSSFAPTVGQLLMMTPLHRSMHLGQLQVIRRRLGKPVLF